MEFSELISQVNRTTGKLDLVDLHPQYDGHQEIARAAYADMLHDHDRNMRYFEALKYEIGEMKKRGETANVLDIGTGTGLLSMMAVVAGADAVFACDAFTPMVECARKVIKRNNMEDRITLIPKRSNELVVGVDLPFRCNILVTEVFDTELIGEAAIATYNHAHLHLLTNPAVTIPDSGVVYAQVMDCDEVAKFNTFQSTEHVQFPDHVIECAGVPSVQDLQLDAIEPHEFVCMSPPIEIFKFDFTSRLECEERSKANFTVEKGGTPNAVFFWWDLNMDTSGDNVLSCQPAYVRNGNWSDKCKSYDAAWRDHWMHAVYYIPKTVPYKPGEVATLHYAHDEFSFWFDIQNHEFSLPASHPVCECRFHATLSRYNIYMINRYTRVQKFVDAFKSVVNNGTVCLCVSSTSVLPFVLSRLGAKTVYVLVSSFDKHFYNTLVSGNSTDNIVLVESLEPSNILQPIDLITGDPYFSESVYPWSNLSYWYTLKSIKRELLSKNVMSIPSKGVLRIAPVQFTHLWKIDAPVGIAADQFDLQDFDTMIHKSSMISDSRVDVQPLWEYETTATGEAIDCIHFDLTSDPKRISMNGELTAGENTNGVALWMDWKVGDKVVSTGPIGEIKPGDKIKWERFSKQGVYFIKDVHDPIKFNISFLDRCGEINFIVLHGNEHNVGN